MSGPGTETRARSFDPAAEESALAERTATLVELARGAGAQQAEAFAQRSDVIAVRFEKGDLKLTQVDEGTSLGLRVFRDERLGFASSNQVDHASLESIARDANTLASFSPPDEANVLPAPRPIDERPTLVQPALADYSLEEAVERARDLVARTLARDARLSLDQASLTIQRSSVAVCSSAGVRATESDAQLSFVLFGMAIDGDDVGGFDYWGDCLRELDGLEASMERSSARFAAAALGNLGAGAAETYRGPVLFAPQAFQEVFLAPLVSAAGAIAVQRGRSALAGKLGQTVAHSSLSISDDPTDRGLAGAARFDREGQPARTFPIVESGVLRSYLYNGYAAAVDGVDSTGHAAGGARAVPGLGAHALVVAGGDGGASEDLARTLGKGLMVQRFSGTVDPASGDFSGVAKSARWVEGGELVRPVRETLISGNAFELLADVVALSTGAESLMGAGRAPWALIDGVSVTAG